MKKTSGNMKLTALTTAGALALFGGAFASSASADSTPTPTPTISSASSSNAFDAEVNDETVVQALIGDNQDELDILDAQVNADVSNEDSPAETPDTPEIDIEVDAINAENQQESDSFSEDVTQAEQSGNHDDAVELAAAASIVTSVTAPEVAAMASDDNEAHAILVGTVQK